MNSVRPYFSKIFHFVFHNDKIKIGAELKYSLVNSKISSILALLETACKRLLNGLKHVLGLPTLSRRKTSRRHKSDLERKKV